MKGELIGLNFHEEGDTPGMFKIDSDPRVTSFGARLRRWSLDELPQFWNVLRGDMSLVGPRPLIPSEAVLVEGHYRARFETRPGITGAWQTLGRSDIGFEDMLKLDYTYVSNWSFSEDIKLLARTAGAVAAGRGAY
jgi:lipopolysaccharide/colanic/teichoic acid biosynthesis glycosyltransferase